jgi:hypothetical protein
MFPFQSREQCEEFQMTRFGISCSTCERSDDECPWHRQHDQTDIPLEGIVVLAA